jgi:hypothetical protein
MLSFLLAAHIATTIATTSPKAHIEAVFGTSSPMVAIAQCESSLRQFEAPNHVLRGRQVESDVGIFQVNVEYHGSKAKEMGINLYTLDGNIQYAKYLYDRNGTKDWLASRRCWQPLWDKT